MGEKEKRGRGRELEEKRRERASERETEREESWREGGGEAGWVVTSDYRYESFVVKIPPRLESSPHVGNNQTCQGTVHHHRRRRRRCRHHRKLVIIKLIKL